MRSVLIATVVGQTLAGSCCWSKWGDDSSCGNYPPGGSGGICGKDGVTKCSGNTDCTDSPPAPTPGPSPTPTTAIDKVLLVGLYKDWGASVKSYALNNDGASITPIGEFSAGKSPSWITAAGARSDGKLASLFAVSETGNTVASLSLGCNGQVLETSRVSSEGDGPVHLSTDGEHVLVANYGGGSVAVLPVSWGSDGTAALGAATQTLSFGADAHAHSTFFEAGGVYVPTLGLDQVQQLAFQDGQLSQVHEPLTVPAQQGPRHMAFHPSLPIGVLTNEGAADAKVTIELLGVDAAQGLSTIATYDASGPYSPPDMYPAEVLFSPSGDFVLISVRDASEQKRDGVVVFKVEGQGASLSFVGYTSVGWYPRSMALTEQGLLIVGNQKGNSLSLLQLDLATGTLTKSGEDLSIGDSPGFVGIFDTAKGCTEFLV